MCKCKAQRYFFGYRFRLSSDSLVPHGQIYGSAIRAIYTRLGDQLIDIFLDQGMLPGQSRGGKHVVHQPLLAPMNLIGGSIDLQERNQRECNQQSPGPSLFTTLLEAFQLLLKATYNVVIAVGCVSSGEAGLW